MTTYVLLSECSTTVSSWLSFCSVLEYDSSSQKSREIKKKKFIFKCIASVLFFPEFQQKFASSRNMFFSQQFYCSFFLLRPIVLQFLLKLWEKVLVTNFLFCLLLFSYKGMLCALHNITHQAEYIYIGL